ncbi:MAG: hypothetical protein K2K00_07855 [Muribaculaceae bacterium]|nr:hypothetical protein [Muribaculaceae bacterium]
MSTTKKVSEFFDNLGASAKGVVKIILQSRPTHTEKAVDAEKPLIILANGPSLRQTIDEYGVVLKEFPTLAVNFAANTPEFRSIKPNYYVLADPHFFKASYQPNIKLLWENIGKVDWEMRLFIDRRYLKTFRTSVKLPECVKLDAFNAVGVEGFGGFEKIAYSKGLAMPRPRNVLIPSIMIGIALGYKNIYLCGADHSWMRDLHVTDENEVVSGMNHFYKDDNKEIERSRNEYRSYRLHQIIQSFYTAFLSYHKIRRFADSRNIKIFNSTPGSYIDAFERRALGEIRQ